MDREIKFRRNGCHSSLGNFAPGDLLRCHPLLAAHLVEDGCARYVDAAPVVAEDPAPAAKPKRKTSK